MLLLLWRKVMLFFIGQLKFMLHSSILHNYVLQPWTPRNSHHTLLAKLITSLHRCQMIHSPNMWSLNITKEVGLQSTEHSSYTYPMLMFDFHLKCLFHKYPQVRNYICFRVVQQGCNFLRGGKESKISSNSSTLWHIYKLDRHPFVKFKENQPVVTNT